MKIIKASRDQSDPIYGPRAGNQCMSNCFMFLHTSFLTNVESILNTDSLNQILENGAKLDAETENRIRKSGTTQHIHRLESEISTVISSPFGITGHALSRPFNGTAETQDLGGYKCLGILDFLLYTREKPQPTYIIITVGAHTRGLIVTNAVTFVFDPHTTDLSREAAVYVCDDLNEVISALSFFGALVGDFYYDASIIYLIECVDRSISPSRLLIRIMDKYKDPDIDVQNVSPSPTSQTQISQKQGKKRRASETHQTYAKSSRQTRKLIRIPESITTILVDGMQTIEKFRSSTRHMLKSVPIDWTLQCRDKPFHHEYYTDITRQLLAKNIDTYVGMDRVTDENIVQEFESLMGLSTEVDDTITNIRKNDLSVPLVYKNYILPKLDELTPSDGVLATKIAAIFTEKSETCFKLASEWVKSLLQYIPVENASVTDREVDKFISNNAIPSPHDHMCLSQLHVRKLSEMLLVKRNALMKKYIENDTAYKKLLDAISKLGFASDAASAIRATETRHLNDEQLISLKQAATAYSQTAHETTDTKVKDLLTCNYNRILTGSLPDTELSDLLKVLRSILNNTEALRVANLIDDKVYNHIKQNIEDIEFLQTGKVKLEITPSEYIRKLRSEYDTAKKQISDKETQIKELIANIEDMLTENSPSQEAIDLARTHIQEMETMPADETDIQRADRVISAVSEDEDKAIEFVRNMSSVNTPSQSDVKSMRMLRSVLMKHHQIRQHFVDTLTKTLGNLLKQISEDNPPQDDTFSKVITLIDHLPDDEIHSDLLNSVDIISQLSRRIRYAINQKHTTQSLEDVMEFFSQNSSLIKTMMKTTWGKTLENVYYKIENKYTIKIEETRVSEWLKRVKETDIDSPETLQKLVSSAPNKDILDSTIPELNQRLQKRMEIEAEKRAADLKRIYDEIYKKLENDLKVISDSFTSLTPSIFSSIDLKGSNVVLDKLTKEDRQRQITLFNNNLSKSLIALTSEIGKNEKTVILCILQHTDPATVLHAGVCTQKHTNTLLSNIYHTISQSHLLLPETKKSLLLTAQRLSEIRHMHGNWRNPEFAFSSTHYLSTYKTYTSLTEELKNRSSETKSIIIEKYKTYSSSIHDNTVQSDITIKPIDQFPASLKDTIAAQPEPFGDELKKLMQYYENDMKDALAGVNLKLKTKLERHLAKRQSEETRWSDLITHFRIRAPEGLDIDTTKLATDTVLTLNQIISATETNLPYISSKRVLEWTTNFIISAINEKKNNDPTSLVPQLVTLLDRCRELTKVIEDKVGYNTKIETDMLTNAEDTPELLSDIQRILNNLDPKRIVGGEKRYKILSDIILTKQNKLAYAEEFEKLSTRYFELAENLRQHRYGLNFEAQLEKINALKSEVASHKKDPPDNKVTFPDQETNQVSISSLLMGLSALERYVISQRTLLDNLIASQPLISHADIPTVAASEETTHRLGKGELNRTDAARLSLCDINIPLYRCIDVFGEKRIMTTKGFQLYVYATHGNFIFETFSHIPNKGSHTTKDKTQPLVTQRYKSVTVVASIAATLQTFWSEISKHDIRDILDGRDSFDDKRINTVINLKLFVYLLTVAWSESIPPLETGHPRFSDAVTKEASLLDFCTLMAALHPEYVYSTATSPINNTLASLVNNLDRRTLDIAMNTHENPPPYDIRELKAFCVNTKSWKHHDVTQTMWNSELIKQICTTYPRNKDPSQSTKLFQYLLAIKILPRDVIRCLWTQFKPRYASSLSSLDDLVNIVCDSFFRPHNVSIDTVSGHLNTGEKIESQMIQRYKPHQSIVDDFYQEDAVLDYILGSYVFGIPITCGIHVANIFNNQYRLIVRHLENVSDDPDFQKVIRSRDLTFSQFPWSCTVQNPVERSWFALQEERLRDLLQNAGYPRQPPLIIYDSSSNYVVDTLIPPTKPNTTEYIHLTIKNPFSVIRIPLDDTADDIQSPSAVPIDIDFLRRTPPKLRSSTPSSYDPETQPPESVPDSSLDEPLFSQTKVSSIVPKDAVTTISTKSVSQTFSIHPFRALSTAIHAAIEILQETRLQLDAFESEMCDTIRRIKIMYLH
ncbi:a48 [Rat cytomegalovirus ALL-03]|uniref:A48 n=2 Tax=Rat cytomegalovirus (isolate England) TaxID=1261657 RepID=A0A0F6TGS2_RCMVE|nr:a48 [Rat cytomegalovirus ALL-03]WEG71844.1 large tegument protein [Murid betaherpesvirus 8]WPH25367.1 large tegument protein [Murid betaherpesvirus 8]